MKLDGGDERVLALLGTLPRSVSELATLLDVSATELDGRLGELADNGLVVVADDGGYERTESGRRVLVASATGSLDEQIDTPVDVETAIDEFDLRADEADAVRHAYAFLRYWGQVTDAEVVDAIFNEAAAGRETPDAWWEGLVCERLAALPGIEPPTGSGDAWRFTGEPEARDPLADGRRVLSKTHPIYGDVKHALESLDLTEAERSAARAAFVNLYRRREADERTLREVVFPTHPAGYPSAEAWWDGVVAGAFEALPRVERVDDETWRYRRV